MVTVPFGPLERELRLRWGCNALDDDDIDGVSRRDGSWNLTVGAAQLGVERWTIQKWRERGLSTRVADDAAVRLGTHPGAIWGWDTYEEIWSAEAAEMTRVCDACGRQFVSGYRPERVCGAADCTSPQSRKRARERMAVADQRLAALV